MKLTCRCATHAYDILVRPGLFGEELKNYFNPLGRRCAVIADETVARLYGSRLKELLGCPLFSFPAGEAYKTRATKQQLEDQLLAHHFGRDSCIIALGGGVVTDLVGYIASTYCRGVPFVAIPTSLLAMVDASVGGKTGVNTPWGKNLIGTFYPPAAVLIDPSLLQTLPVREIQSGVVEMIKHGAIASAEYLDRLKEHAGDILSGDCALMAELIFESCRIKKECVESDEREKGKRAMLNFGHTVGHALEHLTDYRLSHGEAVAIGMLVETHMGVGEQEMLDRLVQILTLYGLPLTLPQRFSWEEWQEALAADKKTVQGIPRCVFLERIGSVRPFGGAYCTPVDMAALKNSLNWMHDALKFPLSRKPISVSSLAYTNYQN